MEVTGRNLITGLPKTMRITSDDITEAIDEPLQQLIESIHGVLEHTPAELAADIFEYESCSPAAARRCSGCARPLPTRSRCPAPAPRTRRPTW